MRQAGRYGLSSEEKADILRRWQARSLLFRSLPRPSRRCFTIATLGSGYLLDGYSMGRNQSMLAPTQHCEARTVSRQVFAGAGGLAPRSHRLMGSENQCATAHPNGAVRAVIANVQKPGRVPCQRENAWTPSITRNSCVR